VRAIYVVAFNMMHIILRARVIVNHGESRLLMP
jgi:hypothetical protein